MATVAAGSAPATDLARGNNSGSNVAVTARALAGRVGNKGSQGVGGGGGADGGGIEWVTDEGAGPNQAGSRGARVSGQMPGSLGPPATDAAREGQGKAFELASSPENHKGRSSGEVVSPPAGLSGGVNDGTGGGGSGGQASTPTKDGASPAAGTVTGGGGRGSWLGAGRKFAIKGLPSDCRPLLVFVNKRSGAQEGTLLLRRFMHLLNPLQVIELTSTCGPEVGLRLFRDVPFFRILVAGGDGTVGWVLSVIDALGLPSRPPVAILPLGTGNDLARVFKWVGYYGAVSLLPLGFARDRAASGLGSFLRDVERAVITVLDRWAVTITSRDARDGKAGKKTVVVKAMNNYLGIGVDAKVTNKVHGLREGHPELFVSRVVNKFWYAAEGARDFFIDHACGGLPATLQLVVDGQHVPIPEGAEGLLIANIGSFMGGVSLWHLTNNGNESEPLADTTTTTASATNTTNTNNANNAGPGSCGSGMGGGDPPPDAAASKTAAVVKRPRLRRQDIGDGCLEVMAVWGIIHLGRMTIGLADAVRLYQGRVLEITLHQRTPVHIDGEPWIQEPGHIRIERQGQAFMLLNCKGDMRARIWAQMEDILVQSVLSGTLTMQQYNQLVTDMAHKVASSFLD
eukprot:jgi/Mesvir1/5291/Mv25550-RA.2